MLRIDLTLELIGQASNLESASKQRSYREDCRRDNSVIIISPFVLAFVISVVDIIPIALNATDFLADLESSASAERERQYHG